MSVIRCHKCGRWVDTDFEEMVDWDSNPICEDCADEVMESKLGTSPIGDVLRNAAKRVQTKLLNAQWDKKNVIQEDAKFKAKYRRK